MSVDRLPEQSVKLTLDQALQQGIAHHQAGRLQDAERLYRAILQAQPNHPDANHNLGVLAVQVNQSAAALPHFKVALEANPNQGQYWLSYIEALIQAGSTDVARQVLEQGRQQGLQGEVVEALAVRLEKKLPAVECQHPLKESLSALQAVIQTSKPISKAGLVQQDKSTRKSVSHKGKIPSPQEIDTLGTLFNEGRYADAESLARAMTERYPLHGDGWKALGVVLKLTGRSADALAPIQKAAADAEALSNLGNALRDLGQLDDAVASCRRALEIKPDYAEAHSNLGNALQDMGRMKEAEASYRRALEIKPDYVPAYFNLGNTLKNLGRLGEAEACYRRAIEISSGSDSNLFQLASLNYGLCLGERGLQRESVPYYQQAFSARVGWPFAADRELSSGLTNAYIELTNKCNFHCDFCPSDSQQRTQGFMSLELIRRIYDEIAGKKLVTEVNLHLMGEPTLHPDLVEVLNYAASKKIKTGLVTNGSTLNTKTIPGILDVQFGTLAVSLQTPTRESYMYRGDTGLAWDRYIENIRLLVREHLKRIALKQACPNTLELRVMITKDSKLSAKIVESLEDVRAIMYEWYGFVAEMEIEFKLPPVKRIEVPTEMFAMSGKASIMSYPLQQGLTLEFWRGFAFANSMLSSKYSLQLEESVTFCSRPFLDVAILSNGEVTLCCLDYDGKLAVGNMKDNTIETILNGKATMDLRAAMYGRQPLPPFCQRCQAKAVHLPS